MKLFLATTAGALIVGFAAFALFYVIPAHGAEPCPHGTVAASWYGRESGHKTATGAFFDGRQWLVAHKSFPFGTKLRLTYKGRSVIVPVLDRGPYVKGRVLDLSRAVAAVLGTLPAGVACVGMERL